MANNKYKVQNIQLEDIFSSFDDDLNFGKLFVSTNKCLYKTYSVYKGIQIEMFLKNLCDFLNLSELKYIVKEEVARSKNINKIDYQRSNYLVEIEVNLWIAISNYKIVFFYEESISFDRIEAILEIITLSKKNKNHKDKFYMIAADNHSDTGLRFNSFKIKQQEIDINQNYNNDFTEVHDTIYSFLNDKSNNGLILLHGKYGTGKTSYIRYLMNTVNRRFIFLPLNLINAIAQPNFLPFISSQKNSVLVLEDCESLIRSRGALSTDNSLINLLNLGDGLLSDALTIKLICTFNADLKQIDQAILRKGRLIARYEFRELELIKAKALAQKLGLKDEFIKAQTLANIYNFKQADYNKINGEEKLGF